MKKYGDRKTSTKVKGHQERGTCHPNIKSKKTKARREAKKEVKEQASVPLDGEVV